jgi:hypothetical protein
MSGNSDTEPAAIVDVIPQMAREFLSHNRANRNIRRRVVDAYARDMKEGRWHWNGDPIRFDEKGNLIDGQHRLSAIVESGATIRCTVIRDLPMDVRVTIDSGLVRRPGDVLAMNGLTDPHLVAAVARKVQMFTRTGKLGGTNLQLTASEVVAQADDEDVRESALWASRHRIPGLPPSVAGFCHWLLRHRDSEAAEVFFDGLATGARLDPDDPVLLLRETVRERDPRTMVPDGYATLVVRAWNAWRKGERPKRISSALSKNALPEPV